MKAGTPGSRHMAAMAIGLLAAGVTLASASRASANFISFDEVVIGGPTVALSPDHYLNQGILFGDAPIIWDVAAWHPNEIAQFVAGGITPNNGLALSTVFGSLWIDISFVVPGSHTPAVTSWVTVMALDTNVGTMLGAMEAFDVDGNLIGSVDAITDSSWTGMLSLAIEGIHRIRLSSDLDGNAFDNLSFGELKGAAPGGDIPAPPALIALALGGLLRSRRRRSA